MRVGEFEFIISKACTRRNKGLAIAEMGGLKGIKACGEVHCFGFFYKHEIRV